MNAINKSTGLSDKEKLLAELCERTFLKAWSFPNLYKADGKELCDLFVIFENHAFIFFNRESRKFDKAGQDINLQWARWKKEVVEKQMATLEGAKRYILAHPDKIFMDVKGETPFPINIKPSELVFHKIIVAHGAMEACKNFSFRNVTGSLAVGYGIDNKIPADTPFLLHLDKSDPVHVFDSQNLEIMLRELDTVFDFTAYVSAKEEAIKKLDFLYYCGEEDLLAYYFSNFDNVTNRYFIAPKKKDINALFVPEGIWMDFINSTPYRQRKKENDTFRIWDDLIQKTCDNALNGLLMGNGSIFKAESAIYEMAKEPRFTRRTLSEAMMKAIRNFPEDMTGMVRNMSFMPSMYRDVGYVFLQVKPNGANNLDEYRQKRQAMLELACGVAKNKYPHLNKVIGIGMDAPKYSIVDGEDFILLDGSEWSHEEVKRYNEANKEVKFFETDKMIKNVATMRDFPSSTTMAKQNKKVGRNEECPCGSGKKYKKCCL